MKVGHSVAVVAVALAFGASAGCSSEAGSAPSSGASRAAAVAPVTAATLEKGRTIYKTNCFACHGETGKGDGPGAGVFNPPPRDHTDRAYMSTLTDKQIADVIQMGGAVRGKPLMPSHPQIRGDDLTALVAFVRSLSQPK